MDRVRLRALADELRDAADIDDDDAMIKAVRGIDRALHGWIPGKVFVRYTG